MNTHVEPEEAQAIRDAVQPQPGSAAPVVSPRDFGEPLRLSPGARAVAEREVRAALTDCEKLFERELRKRHELSLLELAEMNAEGLFADQEQPFAILRFEVAGQPGWARWDVAGALAAVETALGASELSGESRELSLVERRLLARLLGRVLERLAGALGVQPQSLSVAGKPAEIGAWRDGGTDADSQRLRLHLELDGPGGASGIDLYLPGVLPDSGAGARRPPSELPEHLAQVEVLVSAHLGACEIPFGELLELEEGDVVPLSTPQGGELRLLAEDVEFAHARMGQHDGRVAIQVTRVGKSDDEEEAES